MGVANEEWWKEKKGCSDRVRAHLFNYCRKISPHIEIWLGPTFPREPTIQQSAIRTRPTLHRGGWTGFTIIRIIILAYPKHMQQELCGKVGESERGSGIYG